MVSPRTRWSWISIAAVALLVFAGASSPEISHTDSHPQNLDIYRAMVRADGADRDWLAHEGFDIAGHDRAAGTVEVITDEGGLERIRGRGLSLRILERRWGGLLTAASEIEGRPPSDPLPDTAYTDVAELEAFLQQVVTDHPAIARQEAIGTSVDGNTIWALMISDNAALDEDELSVLFNGAHHAREVMTPEVLMDIIDQLTDGYGVDPQITALVDAYQIWCVPMVNPDGVDIVFTEDRLWRKNASDNDGNNKITWKDGVDVNRNYEWGWGNKCLGSASGTTEATYRGLAEVSEPETRAMIDLGRRIGPVFYVEYHSYGEDVFYALGCDPTLSPQLSTVQGPDQSISRVIAEDFAAQFVQADGGSGFVPSAYGNRVDGIGRDQHAHDSNAMAFVVELNSAGEGGFQPDYATWRNNTVLGQRPSWLWLLDRIAGPAIGGVVEDAQTGMPVQADVRLDELTLPDDRRLTSRADTGRFHLIVVPGSYTLRVDAPGYDSAVVPLTVGSSWQPITVPLQPDGTQRLVLETFDDDALLLGWLLSDPGDTASAGTWSSGDPHGTHTGDLVNQTLVRGTPEMDRTPGLGAGAFMTGNVPSSPLGANDVDGGVTTLTSPAFDLDGYYAVDIRWQHWIYTDVQDPGDGLEVEVSDDGGQSWLPFGGWFATTSSPQATQAWNEAGARLDDVVAPGPDIRLRYRAGDWGTDNSVEVALDELEIRGYPLATDGNIRELRFNDAAGSVLEWQAVPGGAGATYEVVRGDVASLSAGGGLVDLGALTCVASAFSGTTVTLGGGDPPSGVAWFYVARFELGHSAGEWGRASDGSIRTGSGGCP